MALIFFSYLVVVNFLLLCGCTPSGNEASASDESLLHSLAIHMGQAMEPAEVIPQFEPLALRVRK